MRKKRELERFAKYCFGVLRVPPIAIRYCPSKALVDPAGNFCFGCYTYDDKKELNSKRVWLAYKHPKFGVMMNLAHEICHYKQDAEGYINTMPIEAVENEAERKSEELLAGWLIRGGRVDEPHD